MLWRLFACILLASVLASSCAAAWPRGYHVVYARGFYTLLPDKKMQEDEAYARQGHMPWRTLPFDTASVLAGDLLPPGVPRYRPAGKGVKWLLVAEHGHKALVRVLVHGRPYGEVRLLRPFGYWWYVTSVRRVGVPRSRIVLIHPDGTRENLPGPLLVKGGRAYMPARDLTRVSLLVQWDPMKQAAWIAVPHSDFSVRLRAGSRRTAVDSANLHFTRALLWRPFASQGRLYVSATGIAQLFPRKFFCRWKPQAGTLELRVLPLGVAGVAPQETRRPAA